MLLRWEKVQVVQDFAQVVAAVAQQRIDGIAP
jgi:hypothetical protein